MINKEFLKRITPLFFLVAGLFFLAIVFGYFFPIIPQFWEFPDVTNWTFRQVFFEIISSNFGVSFKALFFGIVLGIYPIFLILINGYVIGYVFNEFARAGYNIGLIFLSLLPHGLFELPAIFLAFALGLKLGAFIFKKEKWKLFTNCFGCYFFIVIPLLLIAAIIETCLIVFI